MPSWTLRNPLSASKWSFTKMLLEGLPLHSSREQHEGGRKPHQHQPAIHDPVVARATSTPGT
ncbi:hypothetical protein ACJ72_06798 [Emergomyces africanus]|uniref:Uncharacterized protein n=1 Tax=Emergomyces africanus TaxID=1955775 RepID=A0A1B7NQI9_9EURO|nr:hypothetical protein ACJ72_06798 [Emergomyces africanus]